MFEVHELSLDHSSISLKYYLTPWDEPFVGGRVAAISSIEIRDPSTASKEFAKFRAWARRMKVLLTSCRLAQGQLVESAFLESKGFRFIELNYRPEFRKLSSRTIPGTEDLLIRQAERADQITISAIAGQIFEAGRFHQDPLIGAAIGNARYRAWASTAFENPKQTVFKCLHREQVVAFFVVESPEADRRFWSLVGLAPGLAGAGLGRRVWQAMLRWHQQEDVETVYTSISSHNTAVHNLYVSLDFRFPPPYMTLHWCPYGSVDVAIR
jgi:hypothetical protein